MNSAQPLDVTPPDSDAALLERVDEIAAGPLAALAYRIDQEGHYPWRLSRPWARPAPSIRT